METKQKTEIVNGIITVQTTISHKLSDLEIEYLKKISQEKSYKSSTKEVMDQEVQEAIYNLIILGLIKDDEDAYFQTLFISNKETVEKIIKE